METYIEAVHCTDDNFQGIEGRFGGSSEVQVVSIDENGEVQRLRLGGADRKETVLSVASVLNASLVSEGVANLKDGGFKRDKTREIALYGRCTDFAERIMKLSSVEKPISTDEDLEPGECNNEPDDKANLTIDLTSTTHKSTGLLGLELVVSTGSPSSDEKGPIVTVDRSGVAMLEIEVQEAKSQ